MSDVNKGIASAQDCYTNNRLNDLRIVAFRTNSLADRDKYFTALSLAFQRGDLIAFELVKETYYEN